MLASRANYPLSMSGLRVPVSIRMSHRTSELHFTSEVRIPRQLQTSTFQEMQIPGEPHNSPVRVSKGDRTNYGKQEYFIARHAKGTDNGTKKAP